MSIELALSIFTSTIAVVLAVAALQQAKAASAANDANFYVFCSRRYSSAKMADALKRLARWHLAQKDDPNRFEAWAAAKRAGAPEALALNDARRRVSRYYFDIASLYGLGLLERALARRLLENNGLNVFYKICDPMNRANQPLHRFNRHCRTLRRLRRSYGDGSIFDSAAPLISRSPRRSLASRALFWRTRPSRPAAAQGSGAVGAVTDGATRTASGADREDGAARPPA